MVLSSFIRRGGKRKLSKKTELHSRPKPSSTSELSHFAPPLVFDIKDKSLVAQRSPTAGVNPSNSNEERLPQKLRGSKSRSSETSLRPAQNVAVTQNSSTQETHANSLPSPTLNPSENVSSVTSRKKSIPAPIVIPNPEYLMPNIQIGHSAAPCGVAPPEAPRPNVNGVPVDEPSSSASDDLSSISGTTLARALIASSFVLSSSDRCSLRHRSGVARQDSATLPRASFFLSDPEDSSLIPPVPPVPAVLVHMPPPSTIRSGASTESEYPLSDAYITSPEMVISSVAPHRISRIQENPSPSPPTLTAARPLAVPNAKPQRKGGPVPARPRAPKYGVFDGPKTAVEVPLLISSPDATQHSSQAGSSLPSSDDHSLDDFDFLPPENLVAVASAESDSSASYIMPYAQLPKRGDINRGLRKRRVGGTNLVRDGSKDSFLTDSGTVPQQVLDIPSAATSEHDYGELFNYDLTVSAESGVSSSASAGYQTFPETPMVFSPLWSPGHTHFAKPDNQVLRRRLPSQKSVSAKLHSGMNITRRHVSNNYGVGGVGTLRRSRSSLLPAPKMPSPKQAGSKLLPPVRVNNDANVPDETNKLLMANVSESQHPVELLSPPRPHPLAHASSSSTCSLDAEVLRAPAQSSLPSFIIGAADPWFDQTTAATSVAGLSDKSPTSIPLPESTDVSPSNSAALTDSSTAASSSPSPLRSSHSTTDTAISQSHPSKSSLSPPSSSQEGSSFLPSLSPPTLLNESFSQPRSPIGAVSSSITSDDLISHSPSPSFIPPPPYHTVVLGKAHHPSPTDIPPLSRTSSVDPIYLHSRQPSNSSLTGSVRSRMRSRPPLPLGPRKPSGPAQVFGSLFPRVQARSSTSSVGSSDGLGLSWRRLHSAASQPPPKFRVPPPKWRGLTLEAAQWTFTSTQLQNIVSQAIRQTSDGSSLRFIKPDVLDGEVVDEAHRLELQYLDTKAQYKALVRKRWSLIGALASHVEGVETGDTATAARTVEELAEVLLGLDQLADKMHQVVHHMAQLKNLRDVHNASSLAMAVRKINGLFVQQMAEKERLQQQVDAVQTERDEAWKHAEELAQDYDKLNDRPAESACACGDTKANADASSTRTCSSRSARISAVRRSSVWQSQAGLRPRSRHRPGRSSSNATRPTSLTLEDIPPIPPLPAHPSMGSASFPLSTGTSFGSTYGVVAGTSAALALADAQREVYEMLGLSLPPSPASTRRRTMSGPDATSSPRSRPVSEASDARTRVRRAWPRQELGSRSVSLIPDDRRPVLPLTTIQR